MPRANARVRCPHCLDAATWDTLATLADEMARARDATTRAGLVRLFLSLVEAAPTGPAPRPRPGWEAARAIL